MFKAISLLLCTGIPALLYAQKNKAVLDSLEKLISKQKDSALVATYNELTWQYRLVDGDKAIAYGNKAVLLGKETGYLKGIAQAYNDLGIIYYDKEQYDTAVHLYEQAVQMRNQLKDELGVAKLYNKIGIVYQRQGLFDKSLDYQLKALELFKKFNNDQGVSYSLNNIGILNQNMGRYKEAISYQKQSIAIKEKMGDNYGLAGSYVNIANIYLLEKDFPQAESYYRKAVDITRIIGDKEYLSNALNNLGTLFTDTKRYNEAIPLIQESLTLRQQLKDTKGMVSCLNNLGTVYTNKQQYDSAELYLNNALKLGLQAVNTLPEVNKVYLSLSGLYENQGQHARSLEMLKEYVNTRDSLYTDELGQNFADLDRKYKTLEKEKTIQQQEFDIKQKEFSITRRNYWIAGISGLLVLGSLLAYSFYRRKQLQQKAALQATIMKQQDLATKAVMEAEEQERQRIARDLHDGIGQMMSAAKMNLSAFESEVTSVPPQQKESLGRIIALVDDSCKEIRSVSHNMMPNALLKNSLAAAIRDFIDKLDKKALQVHLYTEGLDKRIDANVEAVFYRVIQECVNNVIKHSGANTLDISVMRDGDGISATIEDNGKGFDTNNKANFDGIGLKNIITRVQFLKGTVDFDATPDKGTLVAIHVPLNETDKL